MNRTFIGFIGCKWYLVLFMLMLCAVYGSLRGAYKENAQTVWITSDDVYIREQIDSGMISGEDYPTFIGYLGVASEQNEFHSFKLAITCMALGGPPTFIALFVYCKLYDTALLKKLRNVISRKEDESILLIRE